MKNTLWLFLIIGGLLAGAQPAAAFDPGAWLTQGIRKFESRAAADMTRRGNARRELSSERKHKDTVRQIKKYIKAESGKTSWR